MIKRSTAKMTKLRRGTQELLERRGMAASPARIPPELRAGGVVSGRLNPALADPFAHRGQELPTAAAMAVGPNRHPEFYGHRHRGAEQHSAHAGY